MWVDHRVIEVFLDIHGFHECFECVVLASVFLFLQVLPLNSKLVISAHSAPRL